MLHLTFYLKAVQRFSRCAFAMEVVGFTFGAIALASLFSTCVECFDYLRSFQSSDEELDILLVKLDLEKTRLLIWGNSVGVLQASGEGRAPQLDDPDIMTTVRQCLKKISVLLTDSNELQRRYGLRATTDTEGSSGQVKALVSYNNMSLFKIAFKRFYVRCAGKQVQASPLLRVKWAIREKAKFEELIHHLKDFIDGLNLILPVPRETQDRIIEEDISSILRIESLQLVQAACDGIYSSWSTKASAIIAASEAGTVDRRNVEERIRDVEGVNEIQRPESMEGKRAITLVDGKSAVLSRSTSS